MTSFFNNKNNLVKSEIKEFYAKHKLTKIPNKDLL